MAWINSETGELADAECPHCAATKEWAENQVRSMEIERRKDRAAVTRMKNEMEAQKVAKRDASVWKEALRCWQLAFPSKRPTSTGVKSARATAFFQRLEAGATLEDVLDVIAGGMRYPYVVYGVRRESGSPSDRKDDLQDLMHLGNDGQFDMLRDVGHAMRNPSESV